MKDAKGHGSNPRGSKLTPVQAENMPFKSRLSRRAGHSYLDPHDPRANKGAHVSGIEKALAPRSTEITEHQQGPGGVKSWASKYSYHGPDAGTGLHKFSEGGGTTELFAKRNTAPSGWHIRKGKSFYEFVRSARR